MSVHNSKLRLALPLAMGASHLYQHLLVALVATQSKVVWCPQALLAFLSSLSAITVPAP